MAKGATQKAAGLLQSIEVPSRRWAQVSVDFITGLPETEKGHDAILTIVDSVSKMAHFVPTKTTATAADTVELLADRLVRYHGLPQKIISDRDVRFTSELWELFCKRFKIQRGMSSAWHPQTDGQTERVHRTLEQILRCYIQSDERQWENLLPAAELAYNCTVHNTTGMTPFEVMIGENPLRAADLELQDLPPTTTPPMTRVFRQMVDKVAKHIAAAQRRQKQYADQHRREEEFQEGELVWLSSRNMTPRGSPKLQPKYVGPYKIIQRIGKVAYKLDLPPSMQQHPVFHVSLLSKYDERPPEMRQEEGWEPVTSEGAEGQAEYEVEEILDSRGEGANEEYLVKWKGYSTQQATWEPVEHLKNSAALLRAFRRQKNKRKRRQTTAQD